MDALNDRGVTNKLRAVVANAEGGNYLSASEAGFIVTLVERFRTDVEKKLRQMAILQGELNQLKTNEQIIISLVENIVAAEERNKAREETIARLKESRTENQTVEPQSTEEVKVD